MDKTDKVIEIDRGRGADVSRYFQSQRSNVDSDVEVINDVNVIIHESQLNGMNQHCHGSESATSSQLNMWVANDVHTIASILDSLDEIRVHQHLDVVEVCLGWERNNRYSLYNKNGEQVLYIYETAQCVARQCYGSLREFTMVVTDNDDNRLLYLQRPLRCTSRCFYACCCLQELSLISPEETGDSLGVVNERWSMCIPKYDFKDPLGSPRFTLQGSCTHYRCCCDIHFIVKSCNGYEMAKVCKQWKGCKDIIGASNDFTITYFEGLTKEDKVMILGATFLLDFNYFERHGKCF